MRLRASSLFTPSLSGKWNPSRQGAETAGWFFLFGFCGGVYFFATANPSWVWVSLFSASLFLLVTLGIFWEWAIFRRSPINARNVVLCGVLFWLLLDPLLLRTGIDDFAPALIIKALLYAGLFTLAVWIGHLIRPLSTVSRFFSKTRVETNDNLLFFCTAAIYLVSVLPLIMTANGVADLWRLLLAGYTPDVDVGWRRGMLGDQQDFLKSVSRLLQLTIPFLGTYLLRRKLLLWQKILLALMMLSLFITIFLSGERRVFALIVLGPLVYVFFGTSRGTRKKSLPIFAALLLVLFWLMQAQVQFRSGGFYNFDAAAVESNPLEMHRDNNFYWFATAVDNMPGTYDFTNEWIFLQLLTHPVPRFLWPGKPYTTGFPFIQWEEAGSTLSISVVGELYVSQGLLGIVVGGLVYGWLARHWDELRKYLRSGNASGLIYSTGLALLLIAVRSFGDLVLNWYVLALVIILLRCLRVRPHARRVGNFWATSGPRVA